MMLSSPAVMAHPSGLWLTLPGRMSTERTGEIAQRWMEMVLGEKFSQGFPKVLLSGEWLCALANKLFLAIGMRDHSCASSKTSWPSAMSVDSVAAISTAAVAGSMEDPRSDERRSSERIRDSSDMWLQQKKLARDNVEEYLRACEAIGVLPQDIFDPEDLLELRNLDKVYRNLLALQNVAVAISHRRSIDARSSASISLRVNVSDSTVPSFITSRDSVMSIRSSADVTKDYSPSWDRLLTQYELQQLKSAKQEDTKKDLSQTQGIGKLAHDTWRTEEHIRALLLRDDGSADPVPDNLHGKLWLLASGAAVEIRRRKGEYERYVAMELEDTDATRQIDADLHRTVPDEDKVTWNEEKSKMMRRVLVAYSFYNPALGYCQGLNYIVARLLLFVDEVEAFFLLTKMLRLVPDDYYTTMLGLAVDQHVFADLVRLQAPEIVKHLEELGGSGMELSLACTEWFLTLFSSPCPKDVTVRIWDLIFLIGDEILFRIALALLDLEKAKLLKCNSYGDMLHSLNEIGRHKIDAKQLMLDAQKKDVVSRLRLDDFRAHHRLQLATGIAVQSVEEANDPTNTEPAVDSKEEAKAKLFGGGKKRQGLFKGEKNPGRTHRTFDRHLTDDYAVSLQKEHPTFSCYYDGRPPIVFDQYWGSAASQTIWGRRNYRRITEATPPREHKEERRRLQSDGSGLSSTQRIPDESSSSGLSASRSGSGRERRSKSIALIPPNKGSSSPNLLQHTQQTTKPADDDMQQSRSPKGWLQRIEGWHKDLKIQKERKKMEKIKMKLGLADNEPSSLPSRGLANRERGMNHTFAAPTWRHINENELRGNSFDGHQSGKSRVEKRSESMDVNVSARSYSDPFLSPNDIHGRGSFQDPAKQRLSDEMETQIKIRSQESDKADFSRSRGSIERRRSGSHARDSQGSVGRGSIGRGSIGRGSSSNRSMATPTPNDATPPRRPSATTAAAGLAPSATAALNAFDLDATDSSRLSFDMGKPAVHPTSDATHRGSVGRAASADVDDTSLFPSLGPPPTMRRNQSTPVDDAAGANLHLLQQQLHNQTQFYGRHTARKMTPETARVIRERAQVLSYMQRKVSDASSLAGSFPTSSLAGSFPLTPGERTDVLRISESSSDSSRYSEFMLSTTRSAKSIAPPPPPMTHVRKSSFSFFDKLSSDLDDLHGSFMDDSEPRESFDSAIFSRTWSPSSAHHKILAATTTTD